MYGYGGRPRIRLTSMPGRFRVRIRREFATRVFVISLTGVLNQAVLAR
jgi:hypothetical protein